MLEIKYVRQNLSELQSALDVRGTVVDLGSFKKTDAKRREVLLEIEELRHHRNVVSERIAELKKAGEDTLNLVAEMRTVAGKIKTLDKSLAQSEETINSLLLEIPNIPHS